MKAILLAGKGVTNLPSDTPFETSLAWILNSLSKAGVEDVNLVGGKNIDVIKERYNKNNMSIIHNPNWEKTGPLESLLFYEDIIINSDILISFVDVVYTKEVISDFLAEIHDSQIKIVTDIGWYNRYNRSQRSLNKAEKIWLDDCGHVKKASRYSKGTEQGSAEYTGLCYIKKGFGSEVVNICKYLLHNEKQNKGSEFPLGFMDLFTEFIKQGHTIENHSILGSWAELDNSDDFKKFIFRTKSSTLSNLKGQLQTAKILTQVSFTIEEWRTNKENIISKIQTHFRNKELIVRSSSTAEDSFTSSMAGHFSSIIGVNRDSSLSIEKAVKKVIESYGESNNPNDVIFVQPVLPNVSMSGVLFTCHLKTGAPYYCVNWTKSGDTDVVTSGSKGEYHLFYHLKHSKFSQKDKYLHSLFVCATEIEKLANNHLLDIEFAFDNKDELYIFQVRPIVNQTVLEEYGKYEIKRHIEDQIQHLHSVFSRKNNISGQSTILGKMPDWNPAELIGPLPRPLSISLFHRLITKKVWRRARGKIGYFNPRSEKLLVKIRGQPFIDVRNSLNSFTPKNLPESLREKVINEAIFFLKNNPHLHDKLEFDVATTCYTPYFNNRLERWKNFGFTNNEIETMAEYFREHTSDIVIGNLINPKNVISEVENLDILRRKILNEDSIDDITKANRLIIECEKRGTLSFSILARFAFIGNTFLKAFVNDGIISNDSYSSYLNSIDTIATEMVKDLDALKNNGEDRKSFLKKYGHLRPGTFDITSSRYDENPDFYFDLKPKISIDKNQDFNFFLFSPLEKSNMEKSLKDLGFSFDSDSLLQFVELGIRGREYSKFLFTRCISDSLKLIRQWGGRNGFSRDDLSFIDFDFLVNLDFDRGKDKNIELIRNYINKEKDLFYINQHILLPDLITEPLDLISFYVPTNKPNFITNSSVSGEVVKIDSNQKSVNISKKIVMIESSDPGYDWIFTHDIKGLVTKYGGAASHMTIRCAEFNLPAAIGCGTLFDNFSTNDKIIIDCRNNLIKKI